MKYEFPINIELSRYKVEDLVQPDLNSQDVIEAVPQKGFRSADCVQRIDILCI